MIKITGARVACPKCGKQHFVKSWQSGEEKPKCEDCKTELL